MPKNLVYKTLHFKVSGVDEANHIIRGIFSTGDQDRSGEMIDQKGWKLDEYLTNPVVLWSHDYETPAIGQVTELTADADGNLVGAVQFAYDVYELAATIFDLYAGRYLRAFSVGFINNVQEYDQVNDTITLLENTLYEISCVNVPSNAMALAYAKGINMKPIEKANEPRREKEDIETHVAVEVISKQNIDTIKSAIVTLGKVVDAAKVQTGEVEIPAQVGGVKKIPISLINKAIRELHAVRVISKYQVSS